MRPMKLISNRKQILSDYYYENLISIDLKTSEGKCGTNVMVVQTIWKARGYNETSTQPHLQNTLFGIFLRKEKIILCTFSIHIQGDSRYGKTDLLKRVKKHMTVRNNGRFTTVVEIFNR